MQDEQQLKPRQPPRLLFKVANPLLRVLLASPLHRLLSQRLMLLTFRGRKSGQQYITPVGYARVGNTLYTGTQGRWASNLRGGAPVRVTLQGARRPATAEVDSDVDGLVEVYRAIYAAAPGYAKALSRSTGVTFGPNGEVNRDEVERAKDAGHVIIRTTLDSGA